MSITNATLATAINSLIADDVAIKDEFQAWLNGTVGGGPNSNGKYPLTDYLGTTILVACPAQQADDVSNNVTGSLAHKVAAEAAQGAAQTAQTAAELAETNAETAQTGAVAARDAALSAQSSAESARTTAIAQAGSATISAAAALASESAAAISETNSLASEVAAAASAAAAAASALVVDDTLFAKLADDEIITGAYTFRGTPVVDKAINGPHRLVLGTPTATLRGDSNDGYLTMTGENAGVVYGFDLYASSTNLFLSGGTYGGATAGTGFLMNLNASVLSGKTFKIQDSLNTSFVQFQHGGTDVDTTFVGTEDWSILGLTGAVQIFHGAGLRIATANNADWALSFTPAATAGATSSLNTSGNLSFSPAAGAGYIQTLNGGGIRVYDSLNTNYIQLDSSKTVNNWSGVWLRKGAVGAPSSGNYSLLGDGVSTKVNAATTGDIGFRINNAEYATLDATQFAINLPTKVRGGNALTFYDSTNNDSAAFSHDGTNFNTSFFATAAWNVTGATTINLFAQTRVYWWDSLNAVATAARQDADSFDWDYSGHALVNHLSTAPVTHDFRDGATIRIRDALDTDFVQFSHDGTYFNVASNLTDAIRIAESVWVTGGNQFRIYDSTGIDNAVFSHDGTDFNTSFVTTADWNITGLDAVKIGAATMTAGNVPVYVYGYDTAALGAKYGKLSIGSDGSFNIEAEDTYLILNAATYIQAQKTINMSSGVALLQSGTSRISSTGAFSGTSGTFSDSIYAGGAASAGEKILRLSNTSYTSGVDFVLGSTASLAGLYDRGLAAWIWSFEPGIDRDVTFYGAVSAASYSGILAGDLVDKSAAETIGGAWAFSSEIRAVSGVQAFVGSAIDVSTYNQDAFWQSSNSGIVGNYPKTYSAVYNLGRVNGTSAGMQLGSGYGGDNNSFFMRRYSDNAASENGANVWQNWKRIMSKEYGDTLYEPLDAAIVKSDVAETIAANWTFQPPSILTIDLVSGGRYFDIKRSDTGSSFRINMAGEDFRIYNTLGAGSDFLIGLNASTVDEGNRLGVGITPTERLHVLGNIKASGNVTAATIGGITEANLVDKSAYEFINGEWQFRNQVSDFNGITVIANAVTPISGAFGALNRAGTGNYSSGFDFRFTDANAGGQLVMASDGSNLTPKLYARTDSWTAGADWQSWYRLWTTADLTDAAKANYDTAYGWGDHALGGYLKADGSVAFTGNQSLAGRYLHTAESYRLNSVNGSGIGFWNGAATTYGIYMSLAGDATYGGRVTGDVTSDYNIYFEMNSGTNRGFVFETDGVKLFGVNPDGVRSSVNLTAPNLNVANWDTAFGWGDHSGLYSLAAHTHSGVYEPVLGNPGADGYVLSSTAAGVRSWVASGGGGAASETKYVPTGNYGVVSTTMASVTGLTGFAFDAGAWYKVEGFFKTQSNTTADINFRFSFTNATQDGYWTITGGPDSGTVTGDAGNIISTLFLSCTTNVSGWHVSGYLFANATTGGTCDLQASVAAVSGTTTVYRGSWLTFTKMS